MKVVLVGAGPGDPGLLTIRGREELARADTVVYDALADARLLAYARKDAELIYVGKIAGQHSLPQEEINQLLVSKAQEGKNVVRLKGGDPYIFGRGGEEGEFVAAAGIPFEEVPGISSAIAAPAYAGIPLTHRDFVSSVMLITGHEKPDKKQSAHNWRAFVETGATLVFVMGMRNLASICASLLEAGMNPAMPAAVIYRGATPMQRTIVASLQDLPQAAAQLANPAIIVIGRVVNLRESLDWFSQKPLLGRNIVVTRAREQASGLIARLADLGASVLECPAIEIAPLADYSECDAALANLAAYGWLIFTSVNGVKYFWQRLQKAGMDSRSLCNCRVAAIGPATAAALLQVGIRADLEPESYVAEALAAELIAREGDRLNGMRILLPRALKARSVLPDELVRAGAIVDVLPVYQAIPAKGMIAEVKELLDQDKLDCIAFASSSTVENFLDLLPASELARHSGTILAAIGPITAATLKKHGLSAQIQPETFTIPALVQAIVARLGGGKQ